MENQLCVGNGGGETGRGRGAVIDGLMPPEGEGYRLDQDTESFASTSKKDTAPPSLEGTGRGRRTG